MPPAMAPGRFGWNELLAGDVPTVWPFYATMFGWTKADAIDMGPMGTYQLFASGGTSIGGMMNRPPPNARRGLAVLHRRPRH